ncbi:uncharacterized protein LOC129585543 [Paramacrobiotus metropolitanus]|uniref:uncharacterized protein LOC129585543 n=1 Tax=Paramacrobiotus metropolitanus TaxID=2943436 RepID=UPI002445C1EB|nr:uncharacterized protein LOC129585543 [Paramacrobiotus metropolitanus]
MTSLTSQSVIIQSLKTCLLDRDPVTFGVCRVPVDDFGLFYGKGDAARQLYLHNASDAELELLARACTAATFGINQQDVFDETKTFTGVTYSVYKCLTCLGAGGFFKAHKDTPRGANMFGSLVIVFPTKHTGGELKLRHGGKEWTFDSAKELAAAAEPSIGYVAFFSDVEHEVAVVQSGYRVTLTYNLYFGETVTRNIAVNHEQTFKTGLEQLLADPTFLPQGGLIGFGLQHEYPVNAETQLCSLMECLKGSDALIGRVCQQLSLPIQPKMLTETEEHYDDDDDAWYLDSDDNVDVVDLKEDAEKKRKRKEKFHKPNVLQVLTDHVVDLSNEYELEQPGREMLKKEGVLILPYSSGIARRHRDASKGEKVKYSVDIQWITEATPYNHVKTEYIAYGNEATLDYLYAYGSVCLAAKVGPAGKRIE